MEGDQLISPWTVLMLLLGVFAVLIVLWYI